MYLHLSLFIFSPPPNPGNGKESQLKTGTSRNKSCSSPREHVLALRDERVVVLEGDVVLELAPAVPVHRRLGGEGGGGDAGERVGRGTVVLEKKGRSFVEYQQQQQQQRQQQLQEKKYITLSNSRRSAYSNRGNSNRSRNRSSKNNH